MPSRAGPGGPARTRGPPYKRFCQTWTMEETGHNGRKDSRMDRLEHLMDLLITDHLTFADEHKRLLTAQVLLTDRMDKLTVTVQELAEAQKRSDARMDERMKATDERLNALIT